MAKIIIVTIVVVWLTWPGLILAQQHLIGGQIQKVTICCNGLEIKVGSPNGGTFLFVPKVSTLYPFYNIFTKGVWVLGTAYGKTVCLNVVATIPCTKSTLVTGGIINIIGTSSL